MFCISWASEVLQKGEQTEEKKVVIIDFRKNGGVNTRLYRKFGDYVNDLCAVNFDKMSLNQQNLLGCAQILVVKSIRLPEMLISK